MCYVLLPEAAEYDALKPTKEVKLCCEAGFDGGISCAHIEPHNEDDQKTGQGIVPVHQQHDQQFGKCLHKIQVKDQFDYLGFTLYNLRPTMKPIDYRILSTSFSFWNELADE